MALSRNSRWLVSEYEEYDQQDHTQQNQQHFKLFCITWDRTILQQKGPFPKYTVLFTVISSVISMLIEILIVGFGTDWYLAGCLPMWLGTALFQFSSIYDLRVANSNKFQKRLVQLMQAIAVGIFTVGFALLLLKKIPFNNVVIFVATQVPLIFVTNFTPIQTNLAEHHNQEQQNSTNLTSIVRSYKNQYTTRRDYGAIYRNQIRNQNSPEEIYKKRKQLLLLAIWVALSATVTGTDVLTDVYYGLKLIIVISEETVLLKFVGAFIMLTATTNLFIYLYMVLKPQSFSYVSHIVALFLEIVSFAGTAYSLYILLNDDHDHSEGYISDGIQLAVFSLATTAVAIIVHVFYISDYFAQKSALEQVR
eukprot:TRINITY_DN10140_c0_g1_i1.p1 TRINITY_DN10140_c0_g1~~TRINITY_DN10140_c0_g1_i1.p1  ORF type:complete len:364 (-),score=10.60 TRINITY_DN10140_c0_g1_i1:299-1390(-)